MVKLIRADRHRLVIRGDSRQTELMPAAALDHEACQVFLVQPLQHQDDDAPLLVVEPCAVRVAVVPVDDPCAGCFGGAVLGLQGVVDDDEVRTAAVIEPPTDKAARRRLWS